MFPLQALQRLLTHARAEQCNLVSMCNAMLAGLSCASSEVLWWFQHWKEVGKYILSHSLYQSFQHDVAKQQEQD